MTLQEINKAYNRIVGSLDSKELKNAFDSLQALIAGSREYSFQDKLNELQDTYKYMLRYRIEGAKDPMQEQIYNNLQPSMKSPMQSCTPSTRTPRNRATARTAAPARCRPKAWPMPSASTTGWTRPSIPLAMWPGGVPAGNWPS